MVLYGVSYTGIIAAASLIPCSQDGKTVITLAEITIEYKVIRLMSIVEISASVIPGISMARPKCSVYVYLCYLHELNK